MKSVKSIFKIGLGPSSSHTMGPAFAAEDFLRSHCDADKITAELFGSLAKTGKGHGTDRAIKEILSGKENEILFNLSDGIKLSHPNTLRFRAYKNGELADETEYLSVGGGEIVKKGDALQTEKEVYEHKYFSEIAQYCKSRNIRLSDYVFEREDGDFKGFLDNVWQTMSASIMSGLTKRGTLPGGLNVERKAQHLFSQKHIDESPQTRENRIVCAYAFAVSEENADCGVVVTAPTCGSCGVVPAVLKYMQEKNGFGDDDIVRALAVAGIIGDIVSTNASISGAECGCQAEIGTACSMAAAALCELYGMGIDQIEYAAEISLEHHLGLTCDPICGLVQIPCIERNAVAAMRAINALSLANFLSDTRRITFDTVVKTMYQTGIDLSRRYRETSEGGLAKTFTGG